MKNEFKLRFCRFAIALSLLAQPVYAQQEMSNAFNENTLRHLPKELLPLNKEIEEVIENHKKMDPTYGRWQQALAAERAQQQKWLPVIAIQGGVSRDSTESKTGTADFVNSPVTNQMSYSITARQNLYAGGTDQKRQGMLAIREKIARLEIISSERNVIKRWLKDLLQIQYQRELLKFSIESQQQAKQLNQLARRKEASGFLGKRDLLESERELIRIERELQSNKDKLTEVKMLHNQNFGLKATDEAQEKKLDLILKFADNFMKVEPDLFSERTSLLSLSWAIAQWQRDLVELEYDLNTLGRFSPKLDASANIGESRTLGNQIHSSSADFGADHSRRWTIGISGEMAINPPTTFGSVSESLAKLTTAKADLERIRQQLKLNTSLALQQLNQVIEQKRAISRLVDATESLRQQYQRLFEAGEISLDKLILSQQELDRDRKALVSAAHEENALRIELSLSELWNIAPASTSINL